MITLRAFAKINLFLRVTGRRTDGYHEIETLFQRIALSDRLSFERTDGAALELECRPSAVFSFESPDRSMPGAPASEATGERRDARLRVPLFRNLVTRAYEALRAQYEERLGGARVVLEKSIPVGGGLGGGSSDAAAALTGFDRLFGLGIDPEPLRLIATRLGADVPFFLGPSCAVGRGIGERLTPASHSAQFWAVLAFPRKSVSTPAAYARYDAVGAGPCEAKLDLLIDALKSGDVSTARANLHNDLEPPVFDLEPALGDLRRRLESLAEQPVRMTGSGSTMFALAQSEDEAQSVARRWTESLRVAARAWMFEP